MVKMLIRTFPLILGWDWKAVPLTGTGEKAAARSKRQGVVWEKVPGWPENQKKTYSFVPRQRNKSLCKHWVHFGGGHKENSIKAEPRQYPDPWNVGNGNGLCGTPEPDRSIDGSVG